jgi:hypothetical protein
MSNGETDKDKEMDEKREKIADKIISDMALNGASQEDMQQQQKTNEETLGHKGEAKVE